MWIVDSGGGEGKEKGKSREKRHREIGNNNRCSWVAVLAGSYLLPPPQLQSTHRTARVTALLPWCLTPSNATSGACMSVWACVRVCVCRGVYVCVMWVLPSDSEPHHWFFWGWKISRYSIHCIGLCLHTCVCVCGYKSVRKRRWLNSNLRFTLKAPAVNLKIRHTPLKMAGFF